MSNMLVYSSARRARIAVATGSPSSVTATQPAALQFGDVGELFALLSARHRANRIDARQSGFRGLLQDQLRDAGVVVDRLGVRHARHGGEAAGHRRRDAGRHRFLVLLPRLAQVHVHVDEARDRSTKPAGMSTTVPPSASDAGRSRADLGDAIAVDQHVEDAVDARWRDRRPARP